MLELYTRLCGYLQKERGQTMAEYAVVLAVIAVVVVAALQLLAGGIGNTLSSVTETLGV